MSLNSKAEMEARINSILATGVPTQHDLYYAEAIRNEIKYLQHQEDLLKTATYETLA